MSAELATHATTFSPVQITDANLWNLLKSVEARIEGAPKKFFDVVLGTRSFHMVLDDRVLQDGILSQPEFDLIKAGPWFELAQTYLKVDNPIIVAMEIHYRTVRQGNSKWHLDHPDKWKTGLWLNVVVPLDEDFNSETGNTQIWTGDGDPLFLGGDAPRHYYAFDAQLKHRATRNHAQRPKTTLFITYAQPFLSSCHTFYFNLLKSQLEQRQTRSSQVKKLRVY